MGLVCDSCRGAFIRGTHLPWPDYHSLWRSVRDCAKTRLVGDYRESKMYEDIVNVRICKRPKRLRTRYRSILKSQARLT